MGIKAGNGGNSCANPHQLPLPGWDIRRSRAGWITPFPTPVQPKWRPKSVQYILYILYHIITIRRIVPGGNEQPNKIRSCNDINRASCLPESSPVSFGLKGLRYRCRQTTFFKVTKSTGCGYLFLRRDWTGTKQKNLQGNNTLQVSLVPAIGFEPMTLRVWNSRN
jgi:hypothetical protein